tara:strand:+ start:383 stop:508 length:126 start_codon:yes stop_codon:yes gene_type:complete
MLRLSLIDDFFTDARPSCGGCGFGYWHAVLLRMVRQRMATG